MWAVWRIARSDEPAWWVHSLTAAADFARQHGLLDYYRTKFRGISASDMRVEKARAAGRESTFPIWEIANELVVARYLERAMHWTLEEHEPSGYKSHHGDWQFLSPSGRQVFVEVKSLAEPSPAMEGVYTRPSYRKRLRTVLKGAYAQLPQDGRATLVVLVGKESLKTSHGIIHGDLFQSLFGQIQVYFRVLPYDPRSVRIGPSLRDMFVHGSKHRRLGCVAGMVISGLGLPSPRFYAIHNPYADEAVRLSTEDVADTEQIVIDDTGHGESMTGIDPDQAWSRMALIPQTD